MKKWCCVECNRENITEEDIGFVECHRCMIEMELMGKEEDEE